ncbi:MAG: alpha-galactosidase [Acholeplasmataceae bacterium]|nr:alpha-galactosidase [Acholeplasmataceae bacterium]
MRLEIVYRYANEVFSISQSDAQLDVYFSTKKHAFGQHIQVKVTPKKPITLISATLTEGILFTKKTAFMPNGYQSWTETKEYRHGDRMRGIEHLPKWVLKKYQLKQYGDYHIARYKKHVFHGFTYSYMRDAEDYELMGSLNDQNAYLIIYYDLLSSLMTLESDIEHKDIDAVFTLFDFLKLKGTHDQVFDTYLKQLPKVKDAPMLFGYTSWYNHYQNINEKIILEDLDALTGQFNLFQIDDGYQNYIGDWLDINRVKFPNGLQPIQQKIVEKNYIPGIWLAPFVCEKDSKLFDEHPEFIAKDAQGEYIMGGSNWSGFYVLDLELKAVRDYIKTCLVTMNKTYGFKLFKLDFLYAVSLKEHNHQTRAQTMHKAMMFLRECLPDAYILGCGMPLASGFGIVDYSRIGPDISLLFDDLFHMRWIHRERVSTKHAILNTIYRRELSGHVFFNDPDVFLLRDYNIRLTQKQKISLIVMNCLFGHVILTSDNFQRLHLHDKTICYEAKKLLKATDKIVRQVTKRIMIDYKLDGKPCYIIYDYRKGIIKKWIH